MNNSKELKNILIQFIEDNGSRLCAIEEDRAAAVDEVESDLIIQSLDLEEKDRLSLQDSARYLLRTL